MVVSWWCAWVLWCVLRGVGVVVCVGWCVVVCVGSCMFGGGGDVCGLDGVGWCGCGVCWVVRLWCVLGGVYVLGGVCWVVNAWWCGDGVCCVVWSWFMLGGGVGWLV